MLSRKSGLTAVANNQQSTNGWVNSGRQFRVLNCIPSLGGGGAERHLSHLTLGLTRTGVEVHVAYVRPGPNLDSMRNSGVTLHPLRGQHNYDPSILWQLLRTIRQVKPDLVQTWLTQMDILGGLAAMLTGTPFILSEEASALAYTGSWKNKLRTWIGGQANMVVANSETGKEYWIPQKEPKLIKVVPNTVPLELLEKSPAAPCVEFGIGPSTEVILFAGRYDPQKNVLILLEALRQVFPERPDAVALLFGRGSLEGMLLESVKRHGLEDRVRIHGYTQRLWSWMKRANLFVNVSVFEGCPNVVCEAAALKSPLVLSDIPEHRELLGDTSAIFVSPQAPSDIARGILDVLRDPEAARRKADSAYEIISRYSVEAVVKEYINLYRLALARS